MIVEKNPYKVYNRCYWQLSTYCITQGNINEFASFKSLTSFKSLMGKY